MRKTKILATIGPSSNSIETIKELINAGMNGARINFSHGTYEGHKETIDRIIAAREELGAPIPLVLDTRGPEIRIKTFKDDKVFLEQNQQFTLTTNDVEGDKSIVSVTYADLPKDLNNGDRVLLDDGLIELIVNDITDTDIICTVRNGGYLSSRKGVNVPDVYVNLPSLTEKDMDDIKFGIECGFDYIAASFVRSADDIIKIRHVLDENGGSEIEIIAKIENRDGVTNIDEILEVANGIMVARGDLGVEIPPEEVPLVQKMLISKSNQKGKPVITATQMLESMVSNPRPTRAEANDVANAIFDGTDTLMLSGETAKGDYPVEAVAMMARIAEYTEKSVDYEKYSLHFYENERASITNAVSHATCTTATDLNASCIVTVTKSGFTARMMSKFRPKCPIVAVTHSKAVWRKINLMWGCKCLHTDTPYTNENVFGLGVDKAIEAGVAKNGDTVVVACGYPIGVTGTTNLIKVEIVGDIIVKGRGIGNKVASGKSCIVKVAAEAEKYFKMGDILVTPSTNNELIPYMKKASAIVVGIGENINHVHTEVAGAALDIPVVICSDKVVDLIKTNTLITVDAGKGFIYNGIPDKLSK